MAEKIDYYFANFSMALSAWLFPQLRQTLASVLLADKSMRSTSMYFRSSALSLSSSIPLTMFCIDILVTTYMIVYFFDFFFMVMLNVMVFMLSFSAS
jgi:hypothetical protein